MEEEEKKEHVMRAEVGEKILEDEEMEREREEEKRKLPVMRAEEGD